MENTPPTSRANSPSRRARRQRSRSPLQEKRSKSHIRTPLQEKSSSETNASRPGKDKLADIDIFTSTPFPTKPQHILLPSTIRKQRSFHNRENEVPGLFARNQLDSYARSPGLDGPARAPVLQLKKSVTTLRDMYEAQERSSRPSTATSNALRSTSSNLRLRSVSSSEGISGQFTAERLARISSDDLALLPSLNTLVVRNMGSESSFASRMTRTQPLTSSPNYRVYASSSPKIPIFRDESSSSNEEVEYPASSQFGQTYTSSPNFVRLGRSSSMGGADYYKDASSSPNFVRIGTTSPAQQRSSSPASSTKSLKRKRDEHEDVSSFARRAHAFNSSPPYLAPAASSSVPSIQSPSSLVMPSSPPEPLSATSQIASTPVYRLPAHQSLESIASSSAHATLQAALSSSPMPPIQYPVVRAPTAAAYTLAIPKRNVRSGQQEPPISSRLSPVPSEWDEPEANSDALFSSELDNDPLDSDHIEPELIGNESQIHIIAEDHSHEATDELGALPRKYRAPPAIPVRSNSLYGTLSMSSLAHQNSSQTRLNSLRLSMDSRLNSMRSFSHSRQNSFRSNSLRPTSSHSATASLIVPTWARRYYSGFYRDSFQYLYAPSPNNSNTQLTTTPHYLVPKRSQSLIEVSHQSSRTSRDSRRSFRSFRESLRESISERIPSILRIRLPARQSHMTAGVGPLVSNPPQTESIMLSNAGSQPMTPTIRHIRAETPLSPVDPRAHWAGLTPGHAQSHSSIDLPTHPSQVHQTNTPSSGSIYYDAENGGPSIPPRTRFLSSPHLHHDRRLDTASSSSRGYGHPFNLRPKFYPPPVNSDGVHGSRPSWYSLDLRSTQVFLFMLGFVLPLAWFLGAVLPLPTRPAGFKDIEKSEWDNLTLQGQRQATDWEEMDVVSRLRMERHAKGMEEAKWQNARWWRRMNRVMSVVGVVVVVAVVVLAVIGTRGGLGNG